MKYEFNLMPHQTEFVNSRARYCLNSGGVGSGKTYSLVLKAIQYIMQYPGITGLIGAQTLPLLRDTTLTEFINLCPPELIKQYNKSTYTFHFKNKSKLLFRPFDDPSKLKSLNLGFVAIEEMSDVKEDIFNMLRTRLRQINMPCCLFGATNPSSFNNYVYKQFIENPITDSEVIYSKTSDNDYLPEEYLKDLKTLQLTNPEYYKRMVEGHWGSLEGLIFNLPYSQRVNRSAIPKEFDKIIAGLDFGYKHPTALVVIGIKDNKHYIIDEIYKRLQTSADIIKLVKEKHTQYNIKKIYCDWARPEIITDLKNAGLPVTEAIKTVFDGILYTQGLINSGNLICCTDCTYTLREFDSFIWDKKDKEQPLKINDDAMDALRYAVFSSRMPAFEFTEVMQDHHKFVINGFNPFAQQKQQQDNSPSSFNF